MARYHRLLLAALVCAPVTAHASDFSGVLTMMVGIPGLLVANVIAGVFYLLPPSRLLKAVSVALFVPVVGGGVFLVGDALSLLRYQDDFQAAVVGFFALLGLLVVLLIGLLLRKPADPEPQAPPE